MDKLALTLPMTSLTVIIGVWQFMVVTLYF